MLPPFGNYEYTLFLRHCFAYLQLPFLRIHRVGGCSASPRENSCSYFRSQWDYKGKVLPAHEAWILDLGLHTLLGVRCSPGHCSPPPSYPLSSGAPGPSFQEVLSTTLPLDFLLCPTVHIDNIGELQNFLFCFSPSSSPDKETGASSMLLGQPERESISFPPSQVSLFCSLADVQTTLPS